MSKSIHYLVVGIAVSLMASCFSGGNNSLQNQGFKTYELKRGEMSVTVSATGSLVADGSVEVGTEVSGTVSEVLVDFNSPVTKGQVLARLKTDLLEAALHDAEANFQKASAQNEQAQTDLRQNRPLFEKGFLSEKEFLPIKTVGQTAKATLQSAQASLDRARSNLTSATIRSPIDGIILERNIQAGQTVAASFSTPTLFVIARDLTKMKIEALVDETDISRIILGQKVQFTVSAHPDKDFTGVVTQIRKKPVTVQNVINYTVIIDAPNDENLLLPGMTATIEFIIQKLDDVFMVPNEALSITPTKEMIKTMASGSKMRDRKKEDRGNGRVAISGKGDTTRGVRTPMGSRLWIITENNTIHPLFVKTGVTDESMTVLEENPRLEEGLKVIIEIPTNGKTKTAGKSNTTRQNQFRPPMF